MKISIIVPVYNVENYLEKCIDSILSQSYKNIELILINDGSLDKSGEICDRYKSDNVKIIHKKNTGLSETRNLGIKASTGEYLMFVDSDDWIVEDCISEIVNLIKENSNIDIIVGRMINYYESSREYKVDNYNFYDMNIKTGKQTIKYLFDDLYGQLWQACRCIYKKSLFLDNNIYFKSGIISEDLECIPKIYIKANNVAFYNKPFYVYRRVRNGSITTNTSKKNFIDTFRVVKKWIEILDNQEFDFELKKSFYMQLGETISSYYDNINLLKKEDKEEVLQILKEIYILMKYTRKKYTYFKYIITFLFGVNFSSKIIYYIKYLK